MPDTPTNDKIHIADLVTCPKCGQSNTPDERYCTSCGAHLTGTAQAQVVHPSVDKKPGLLGRLLARK